MKKFDVKLCRLIKKAEIKPGFFDFTVQADELAEVAKPGQFAHIKITGKTLRRPISICEIDKEKRTLRFVFQIRGEGTAILAKTNLGEDIDIIAPLGNGFPLFTNEKKAMMIGGGIGTPPLLGLAQHYGKNSVCALGFRNADSVILEKDFADVGAKVLIATDDGSAGFHGLVTELIKNEKADVIYACGPNPMLKAICKVADERQIPCYISLEERMACGVGACLACACEVKNSDGSKMNSHVCKSGPVFNYKYVTEFSGGNSNG